MNTEHTSIVDKAYEQLVQGTHSVIPAADFKKKLASGLASGKKLIIKLGADPTAPDLHLGHAVVLSKLRQFQELGHHIIFLIGDYTARIGDPTGKSKTRPPLSPEDIARNTQTYFEQVTKILDPAKMEIKFNAQWLDQLTSKQFIELCAKVTLARLTERDDFAKRIQENIAVGFHELLYPLLQGYDSVVLRADVELGGSDQTFNLLMGRDLQQHYHQEPQIVMTMPLLEGLHGTQKMSKSLNNYVGLAEPADQAYGKLMSISDTLMWHYMALLLNSDAQKIAALQNDVASQKVHPMTIKKQIAFDIVAKFWSPEQAQQAQQQFEALFQQKDYSQAQEIALPADTANPLWIVTLLKLTGCAESSNNAKRLIESNAIKIDGTVVNDFKAEITWKPGMTIRAGKHTIVRLA